MSEIKKDFVEYFKNNNITFKGRDITEIFPEVLDPKRKKIIVEIEYKGYDEKYTLTKDSILSALNNYSQAAFKNYKVAELPEVFTLKEMKECAEYFISRIKKGAYYDYNYLSYEDINQWLSERKQK